MLGWTIGILIGLLIAFQLLLIGIKIWFTNPSPVFAEIDELSLDKRDREGVIACINEVFEKDKKAFWYGVTAWIVMLIVLPFVKREAENLPKLFRNWDNNVSMNGDGEGWYSLDEDKWYDTRDKPAPEGVKTFSHQDPMYLGPVYYGTKWSRDWGPRHWFNRYLWLGWRNRASIMAKDSGVDVDAYPELVSGERHLHRKGPYGHMLLRHKDFYHYKSIRKIWKIVLIRSYGYKLEISQTFWPNRVNIVAIGTSFKRA